MAVLEREEKTRRRALLFAFVMALAIIGLVATMLISEDLQCRGLAARLSEVKTAEEEREVFRAIKESRTDYIVFSEGPSGNLESVKRVRVEWSTLLGEHVAGHTLIEPANLPLLLKEEGP